MKVQELFEGDVIHASFGKRRGVERDTGIKVPAGYDRFELEHTEGEKSAWIVGVKGDKKTHVSRAALALAKELVKVYNNGGKSDSGIKPISMLQAFGSKEMNILHDAGIKLTEKPTYWEDFEGDGFAAKRNIHDLALKKAEKALGHKFKVYSAEDVYGTGSPKGPLVSFKKKPEENMCIIKLGNGDRYLVDTTQGSVYIRMWQKIV
jgi:hypothetical protein